MLVYVKPFTVRRLQPRMLIPFVGLAAFLAIVGAPWFVVAAWLALVVLYLITASLVLRVDARGIKLAGNPTVPWSAVRGVALGEGRITITLEDGSTPSMPLENVDPAALEAAVSGFGQLPLRSY